MKYNWPPKTLNDLFQSHPADDDGEFGYNEIPHLSVADCEFLCDGLRSNSMEVTP